MVLSSKVYILTKLIEILDPENSNFNRIKFKSKFLIHKIFKQLIDYIRPIILKVS